MSYLRQTFMTSRWDPVTPTSKWTFHKEWLDFLQTNCKNDLDACSLDSEECTVSIYSVARSDVTWVNFVHTIKDIFGVLIWPLCWSSQVSHLVQKCNLVSTFIWLGLTQVMAPFELNTKRVTIVAWRKQQYPRDKRTLGVLHRKYNRVTY